MQGGLRLFRDDHGVVPLRSLLEIGKSEVQARGAVGPELLLRGVEPGVRVGLSQHSGVNIGGAASVGGRLLKLPQSVQKMGVILSVSPRLPQAAQLADEGVGDKVLVFLAARAVQVAQIHQRVEIPVVRPQAAGVEEQLPRDPALPDEHGAVQQGPHRQGQLRQPEQGGQVLQHGAAAALAVLFAGDEHFQTVERIRSGFSKPSRILLKVPHTTQNCTVIVSKNAEHDCAEMSNMIAQKCTPNQRNKNDLKDNHLIKTTDAHLTFGEYRNVFLTEKEYKQLKADFFGLDSLIEQLSAYIQSTGKRYADHAATLRIWAKRQKTERKSTPGIPDYTFTEGESL